jgi:hypothetical protein
MQDATLARFFVLPPRRGFPPFSSVLYSGFKAHTSPLSNHS